MYYNQKAIIQFFPFADTIVCMSKCQKGDRATVVVAFWITTAYYAFESTCFEC